MDDDDEEDELSEPRVSVRPGSGRLEHIDPAIVRVLTGSFKELPPRPTSTVRIFLSSTFSGERCGNMGKGVKMWENRVRQTWVWETHVWETQQLEIGAY